MKAPATPSPERVLQALLDTLRGTGPDAYRCDEKSVNVWHARCPACGTDDHRLQITAHHGSVTLSCALGCTQRMLLAAVALERRRQAHGDPRGWGWGTLHPDQTGLLAGAWVQEHQDATQVARALQARP